MRREKKKSRQENESMEGQKKVKRKEGKEKKNGGEKTRGRLLLPWSTLVFPSIHFPLKVAIGVLFFCAFQGR